MVITIAIQLAGFNRQMVVNLDDDNLLKLLLFSTTTRCIVIFTIFAFVRVADKTILCPRKTMKFPLY